MGYQSPIDMDERPMIMNVAHFASKQTIVPSHFQYPTFYSYLITPAIALYSLLLLLLGKIRSLGEMEFLLEFYPHSLYVVARLVTIGFALGTVALTAYLGRKLYGVKAGIISGLFLCLSVQHIRYSIYALPDVPMTFLLTLSWFFILRIMEKKDLNSYLSAGFIIGLAISTKYNASMAALPLLTAHFLSPDEKSILDRRLFLAAGAAMIGLFFGSLGMLIDFPSYYGGFKWEAIHMTKTGHLGQSGTDWWYHLKGLIQTETTIGVLMIFGVIYSLFRRERQDLLFLSLILPAFFYIGSWEKKSLHYLLFLYPVLALLASRVLVEIFIRLRIARASYSVPLLILILIFPLYKAGGMVREFLLPDNRAISEQWIVENLPPKTRIAVDWAYIPKLYDIRNVEGMLEKKREEKNPNLSRYEEFFRKKPLYYIERIKYDQGFLNDTDAQYLVLSSGCYGRYLSSSPPSPDKSLYQEFIKRKAFYTPIIKEELSVPFYLIRSIFGGSGPVIKIFKRRDSDSTAIYPG
jgi:hypothetical protein